MKYKVVTVIFWVNYIALFEHYSLASLAMYKLIQWCESGQWQTVENIHFFDIFILINWQWFKINFVCQFMHFQRIKPMTLVLLTLLLFTNCISKWSLQTPPSNQHGHNKENRHWWCEALHALPDNNGCPANPVAAGPDICLCENKRVIYRWPLARASVYSSGETVGRQLYSPINNRDKVHSSFSYLFHFWTPPETRPGDV